MATTKNIGQILVDKAKDLDPTYKPDKFNDMGEAAQIILDNMGTGGGGSIDPNMRVIHTLDLSVPIGNNNIGHAGMVVRTYIDNWGLNYFKNILMQTIGDAMGSDEPADWENISYYAGEFYKNAENKEKVSLFLEMIQTFANLGSMTCGLTIPAPEGAKTYNLCPIIIYEDKPQVLISTDEQGTALFKDLTELITTYDGSETLSIVIDRTGD